MEDDVEVVKFGLVDDGSATPLADEVDYRSLLDDNEALKSFDGVKFTNVNSPEEFTLQKESVQDRHRSPSPFEDTIKDLPENSLNRSHVQSFDEEDSLPSFKSGDRGNSSESNSKANSILPLSPDNFDSISSDSNHSRKSSSNGHLRKSLSREPVEPNLATKNRLQSHAKEVRRSTSPPMFSGSGRMRSTASIASSVSTLRSNTPPLPDR